MQSHSTHFSTHNQALPRPDTCSKLLIADNPLTVSPALAAKVGLNEALFLQQIHYWLCTNGHLREGQRWVYNTYDGWREQFPFWSISTIRRTIKSVREQKLCLATDRYNRLGGDHTLWFTIDYDAIDALLPAAKPVVIQDNARSQNEQTVCSEWTDGVSKMNSALPETTTKTNPKTTAETESNGQGPLQHAAPTGAMGEEERKAPEPKTAPEKSAESPPSKTSLPGRVAQPAGAPLRAHVAIVAYHDLHNRYPSRGQMEEIVSRNPPIANWVRAIRAWDMRGHSPVNIEGQLDWAFDPKRMEHVRKEKGRSASASGKRNYSPEAFFEQETQRHRQSNAGRYSGGS